jgi:phosphoenolpyruvate carboxylase
MDAQVPERRELTATDAAQAVSVSALPQAEQHLGHALRRVQALPTAPAYQLARAFAFFFELINLAENDGRWRTMV